MQLVGSRDPVWLQRTLDILVTLIESIGLRTNSDKTKVMTCIAGKIWVALTDKVHHAQQYRPADPTVKRHWVEFNICGASLAAGSPTSHLETHHDTYRSFVLNRDVAVERIAVVYRATADTTGTYFVQFRHVRALQAPKPLSGYTFFDTIPRIWCTPQWKGPFPCRSATDVDCSFHLLP
jgi:hypothetical protein